MESKLTALSPSLPWKRCSKSYVKPTEILTPSTQLNNVLSLYAKTSARLTFSLPLSTQKSSNVYLSHQEKTSQQSHLLLLPGSDKSMPPYGPQNHITGN